MEIRLFVFLLKLAQMLTRKAVLRVVTSSVVLCVSLWTLAAVAEELPAAEALTPSAETAAPAAETDPISTQTTTTAVETTPSSMETSTTAAETSAPADNTPPAESARLEKKSTDAPLTDDQLLTPKVKRNKVKVGKIDTEDFELGPFAGLYSIEDFGSNLVVGARLAIHLSESFFVEGNYGQTKGNRSSAETLLNRDFMTEADRNLTYYNILFGYNFLPGEAFIGKNWAFINEFYLVAGAGNTTFGGEDRFTIVGGFGYRFLVNDWMAVRAGFKDHIFKTDFFGQEKTTHNMEVNTGFTIFF